METLTPKHQIDFELEELRRKKAKRRSKNRAFTTVFLVSILFNALFIYFYFFPVDPIEFKNMPFPVTTSVVHPGQRLGFVLDYCKKLDANAEIANRLVYTNGNVITSPIQVLNNPVGCAKLTNLNYIIPENAPSGTAKLQRISTYKVNLFRQITIISSTQNFTIINDK